eukprot:m.356078 g.356078  ORF g.356078 m.356078 type:complete len:446 (-) comp17432_c0_seq1:298-1635(-)
MAQSLGILVVVCALAAACCGDLVNEDVSRTIDLTSQLATVVTKVEVKNTGSATVTKYNLAKDSFTAGKLAYVAAKAGSKAAKVEDSAVSVSIGAGKSVKLTITQVYTHAQTPFPAEITQLERQLVKFNTNVYFTSSYATTKQTTTIRLAGKEESHTKVTPNKLVGKLLTYGPFTDTEAGAEQQVSVHFENNSPFLTARSLEREILVSHWGHGSVSETIDLVHTGAKLKGSFSRLDFQRNPAASQSAVRSFTTLLPAAAEGVTYTDAVGNISTSNLREEEEAVVLEIQPRFPLYGGWRAEYSVSYSLPAEELLSISDSGRFQMTARFVNHLYDNQVVDKATVRVVLPEGASDIEVDLPFSVCKNERAKKITYFDTNGRPVVVLKKSNLVEEHMQEFVVSYTMPSTATIREPAMGVLFFLFIFMAAILCNRIDFDISPRATEAKKNE